MGIRQKREIRKAAKAASLVLPEEIKVEDPLEALLDEQSDEEFGDIVLKERGSNAQPVKLAEWTAQDFSSIYVRFRPHLERHARRFLRNPSQVDEVVQDAFLYLMVSLPELDSEIGVLRFLKWKTRLLALDVIRASARAYVNSIDEIQEPESLDPEITAHLEQQDDAAVVKLALSKLNPRHREVLIASMYEEKSTEQIAAQVGLTENATRQLIFRARAAFKKALIGDIDTTGMSAAAILSVAARKAAAEGKKIGASAMALIALVVMSLSVSPTFNGSRTQDNVASPPETSQPQVLPGQTPEAKDVSEEPAKEPEQSGAIANPDSSTSSSPPSAPTNNQESEPKSAIEDSAELLKLLGTKNPSAKFSIDNDVYLAETANGFLADFKFLAGQAPVFSNMEFAFTLNSEKFFAKPVDEAQTSFVDRDGYISFVYFGTIPYVFDSVGKTWKDSELTGATVRIEVKMTSAGDKVERISMVVVNN